MVLSTHFAGEWPQLFVKVLLAGSPIFVSGRQAEALTRVSRSITARPASGEQYVL
jgi:hypothetical protein